MAQLLKKVFNSPQDAQEHTKRLVRKEAALGAKVFGEPPKGRQRDFFYYGNNTWIWHEAWKDEKGRQISITTRYEVYPDHIIKVQDGQPHQHVTPEEYDNLLVAMNRYYQLVKTEIYDKKTRAK